MACRAALDTCCTDIGPSAIARIAARFGHLGPVRETLLARPDLPPVVRLFLMRQLSGALAGFVAHNGWLARDRAEEVGREACEKAAVTIAALHPDHDIRPLIRHLQTSGQLTGELTLRALLSGHMAMFEGALAALAGLPLRRVQALIRNGDAGGLRTLFDKAGLPASACVALRETLTAVGKMRPGGEFAGGRLKRRLVVRALTNCACSGIGDRDPLMRLLRRFAVEAAVEDRTANEEQSQADDAA